MTQDLVPDFFVLGAPKCGTTWLYAALEAHPAIDMTQLKECNVLSRVTDRAGLGIDYVAHSSESADASEIPTNWRALYEMQFAPRQPGHVLGDGSLSYMRPYILTHIRETLPEAKFIFLMRDPIARLKSERLQRIKTGQAFLDVDAAIAAHRRDAATWSPLIGPGLYAQTLEQLFQIIPRERVLILVMERMLADEEATLETLQRIFGFLGIDPEAPIALPARKNVALMPRNFLLARQIRRLKRSLVVQRVLTHPLMRDLPLRRLAGRIKGRNLRRPEAADKALSPAQTQQLAEIFAPDIARLETMLGESFPEWDTAAAPAADIPPARLG